MTEPAVRSPEDSGGHGPGSEFRNQESSLGRSFKGRNGRVVALDVFGALALVSVVGLVAWVLREVQAHDSNVYHLAVARLPSDDVFERYYPDSSSPFSYPPSALLLLSPLGLPTGVARWTVFVASVASIVMTVKLTVRRAAPQSPWGRVGPICMLSSLTVISLPGFIALGLGQIAPIVVGLTALGTLGVRSAAGGVWLGAAVSLKLTPAAFVIHWVSVGRRWAAVVAVGTFAAITALAAVIMPRSTWWYFGELGVMRAPQAYENVSNQAVSGVAARLGMYEGQSRWLVIMLSALALAVGIWAARRVHRAGWDVVAVALVGTWSAVASPLSWLHAFLWFMPLAIAIALQGRTRWDVLIAVLVYIAQFVLMLGPDWASSIPIAGVAYISIAVWVTAWLLWRVRKQSSVVGGSGAASVNGLGESGQTIPG